MAERSPTEARTRRRRRAASLLLAPVVLLNLLAWWQAHVLTHFSDEGAASTLLAAPLLRLGAGIQRCESGPAPRAAAAQRITAGDGVAIELWRMRGDGRDIALLFPGYSACKVTLRQEAASFQTLGFTPVLVDFRGVGGSDETVCTIGYREALDVEAAAAWARRTLAPRRLVLYGQSMGAAAILRAAGELGVAADALILEAPFASMRTAVANRVRLQGLPAFPLADLIVFWGSVDLRLPAWRHAPERYARGVTAPTLLIRGGRDELVTEDETARILAALAGPKELLTFPRARHVTAHDRDPETWIREVRPFLDAHSGR